MQTRPRSALLQRALGTVLILAASAGVAANVAAAVPDEAIRYVYDDAGRLKAVSDPASETATYSWDTVGNLLSIRRVASMSLSIIQASPSKGEIGSTITIYGTGFRTVASDNTVKFNGMVAPITSAARTELVVKVPTGATTGPVTVTTPAGTATSADPFTVQASARPVVTSISPTVAAPGDLVTVTGSNFGEKATNSALVNETHAGVSEELATSLKLTTPKSTSGRVSVSNIEGTAVGPDLFVSPPRFTAADVAATGRLTLGESRTYTITAPKKLALYVFDGTQGQRIYANVSAGGVSVFAPDGSQVGSPGFNEPLTLPKTGTYGIVVDALGSSISGTLTTVDVPPDQTYSLTPTPEGDSRTLTFSTPGQNAKLTFEGHAGQVISVKGTNVTGTHYLTPYMPDGTLLGYNGAWMQQGDTNFYLSPELPVDGTYSLVLDPQGMSTGSVTLTAYDATPLESTIDPTPAGDVKDVTLTTPGRLMIYRFDGQAGERLSINASNNTLPNAWIDVVKPDGESLKSTLVSGSAEFMEPVQLPDTGSYEVAVSAWSGATGSIRIAAYDVPADVTDTITPTTDGVAESVDLNTPGQKAQLSFTGTAGQAIAIKGTAVGVKSDVSIVTPTGTTLNNHVESFLASGSVNFYDAERLPVDGTYKILVDPVREGTGTVGLTVYDASEAAKPITPTADGATDSLSLPTPGQNGRFTFSGSPGERISVKLTSALSGHALVSIRGPSGTTVGFSNTLTAGGSLFVDTVTLTASGTHSIYIDPMNAATGAVTVTAYEVPADATYPATPSAAGDTEVVANTTPGQNGVITFAGTAGQRIALMDAPPSYSPPASAVIRVKKPDGSVLTSYFSGATADPITLPTTGTYSVLVDPPGASVGSTAITIWDVPPDFTAAVTPTAAGVTTDLTTTVPGQAGKITFTGAVGQHVFVNVENATFPTWNGSMWLKKPDGTTLQFTNQVKNGSFFDTTLPAAGTYTLLVDPFRTDTGTARITIYDVPPDAGGPAVPSQAGDTKTFTTSTPGQNAAYTFTGTAGQRISLNVTAESFTPDAGVKITKPDGSTLAGPVTDFIDATTLPVSGTYTVSVDPSGASVGSLTFSLYDVPADFTDTIPFTPTRTSKNVTTTVPGQNGKLTFSGTAGQRASMRVESTSYTRALVALKKPDGTTLSFSSNVVGPVTFTTVTLPTTGTYTILVDPPLHYTGTMAISLADVTGLAMAPGDGGATENAVWLTSVDGGPTAPLTAPVRSMWPDAFEGQVFGVDGRPVAGASVRDVAGGPRALTGRTGRFRLATSRLGHHVISVKGGSVGRRAYGHIKVMARLDDHGTRALPRPVWLPRLDRSATLHAARRKPGAIRYSSRSLPGFRIDSVGSRLPSSLPRAGALSLDRMPFPAPKHLRLPVAFGLDRVLRATRASVVYPNAARLRAGTRMDLWAYSATRHVWRRYAHGRVTRDGDHVVAEKPVRVRGFVALMTSVSRHQERRARSAGAATRSRTARAPRRRADRGHSHEPAKRRESRPPRRLRNLDVAQVRRELRVRPLQARWQASTPRDDGRWTTGEEDSPWGSLPPLQARPGITALAGQALTLEGRPLADVRLELEGTDAVTRTDKTGRFLLEDVRAGHHVLVIDGGSAGSRGERYGIFEARVVVEKGVTTALEYTIWMPRLAHAGAVRFDSPTERDVVVKTPHIPGLEVHVPAGSTIRDRDGNPVHDLSITPIPIDRPPFPLPAHVEVPIYFTVQPGGAYLSKGARIIYPNYRHLPAGQRVDFWQYDPDERGWHIYGHGSVTDDAKQVVPDPGVRVWELTGAMITASPAPPGTWPLGWLEGGRTDGDPVDLSSGLFSLKTTDLAVPDSIGAEVTRTYRPGDANSYSFGVGTSSAYDMRLWSLDNYGQADLILPDGGRVHYVRISPGHDTWTDAAYEAQNTPGRFYKSKITWNGAVPGWDLVLRDGTKYVFGEMAPLQAICDRFDNCLRLTRTTDQTGNITQVTTPSGRWIKFTYDTANRITAAVDNAGRRVDYTYNSTGRLATMKNPKGASTTYGYDNKTGLLTTIKDPLNPTSAYVTNTYDANGRVTKQTLADGGVFTYAYTLNGTKVTKTRVTDPMGRIREVTFDAAGYPLTEARAVGTPIEQNTTYERDPANSQLKSVTDELGRKTAYEYDARGNVSKETRLAGTGDARSTTFTYEPTNGRLATVTDSLGHPVTYDYDAQGRLVSVEDATDRTVTFAYDDSDELADAITDPSGKTTRFERVGGDLVATIDPLGNTTRYFVDSVGRRLAVVDPTGRRTSLRYDDLNLLTKVINPARQTTQLDYDANGNLIKVTDARGKIRKFTYDAMNRRLSEVDPLTRTELYAYDKNGNVIKQTDRKNQVTTLQYDALNRLTFAGYGTTGTTTPTYQSTTTYTYDGADRVTAVNDLAGGAISNSYDGFDRLASRTTPAGTVTYGYDGAGRRTSMTVTGQAATTYGYDDANRLLSIARGGASVALTYDAGGRRASLTLPNGVTQEYTYDDRSRLNGITYKRGGAVLGALNYGLDAAGRRTSMWGTYARTGLPAPMTSATYDDANQRITQNGTTLTYDANGHLTKDAAGATLSWNARAQLTSVTNGANSTSFVYDGSGRRLRKTVNGQATEFLYDGPNVVQERRGGVASADLLTGLAVDEVFSRSTAGGTGTFLTDGQGSTLALTDAFGLPTTTYAYDPFGAVTAQGPVSDNPFQYTGRENDGMGLQFNRNRYYSPAMGRFISPDPIGMRAGDANFYAYVGDNPIGGADPSGLTPFPGDLFPDISLPSPVKAIGEAVEGVGSWGWDHAGQLANCSVGFLGGGLAAGRCLDEISIPPSISDPLGQLGMCVISIAGHGGYSIARNCIDNAADFLQGCLAGGGAGLGLAIGTGQAFIPGIGELDMFLAGGTGCLAGGFIQDQFGINPIRIGR